MHNQICGHYLDPKQQDIVLDNSKYLLVVAGAGSGKTLTILGKINYLINYQNICPEEILCISFTKASSLSLKNKIMTEFSLNMPVYTFHKLGLEILKMNDCKYDIASSDLLDNIVFNFFRIDILQHEISMRCVLKYFGKRMVLDYRKAYLKFYQKNHDRILQLEELIITFIRLFKCNNYELSDFVLFKRRIKQYIFHYFKMKNFLILALNVYIMYEKYLLENDEIDFDDMIIKASSIIKNNSLNLKYKYIIIDEYQDTSYIRFLLIKNILDITNAKLMVVGDDFQSIYRFTGCDISLFVNFNKYFPISKIMKIENTYRNSMELITIAGQFVMKNKLQIVKGLKSEKHLDYPIKIIFYRSLKNDFISLITRIYENNQKPIMILGRNNNDIYNILSEKLEYSDGKVIYKNNPNINMYYLTVHRSKGLEEENVIIINLENKLLGFPNKMIDDKVLNLVNNTSESFPYSEERRLFYVALTRTKGFVYLLASYNNPSIFVKELLKYQHLKDKFIEIC